MSFWAGLLSGFRRDVAVFTPRVTHVGVSDVVGLLDPSKMTALKMWETQPHFRTVVSFLARNIAQLGLHAFIRDGEDRRRDRDSALFWALADVDGQMTTYDLVFALVGDLALYDRAYWLVVESTDMPNGRMIRRLPPTWVEPVMRNPWEVDHYRVYAQADGQIQKVGTDKVLAFTGYHPGKPLGSSPTVDALRDTLAEQVEAAKYRLQVWKKGGRVSAVLERPAAAPEWSSEAREAFREDWYAKYTGRGSHAGGTPILEDGMQLRRIDFSAQDQQFVEAAKLSLTTVAAAFHVNPTMIGQNDGANYSNVREFRKMLYGDTLGPLVAQIEARLNRFLIPMVGGDRSRQYVEFNIEEKLQGNFEEQSVALQSSTGAPWMTRNEARAVRNLPALPGGDELVVPLNVLMGGQASPRDSGAQNRRSGVVTGFKVSLPLSRESADAPLKVKAEGREEDVASIEGVLSRFFKRQEAAVLSALGGKAPVWWDEDKWDRELTDDLLDWLLVTSADIAVSTLDALGLDASSYSIAQTRAFLSRIAASRAAMINDTTLAQLEDALDGGVGEGAERATPEGVFEQARGSRVGQMAVTLATTVAGFAAVEALNQSGRPGVTKTWVTTSGDPRPSHAVMDGETVPLDDTYSNGMMWPGDISGAGGDAGEIANCSCISELTIP